MKTVQLKIVMISGQREINATVSLSDTDTSSATWDNQQYTTLLNISPDKAEQLAALLLEASKNAKKS